MVGDAVTVGGSDADKVLGGRIGAVGRLFLRGRVGRSDARVRFLRSDAAHKPHGGFIGIGFNAQILSRADLVKH